MGPYSIYRKIILFGIFLTVPWLLIAQKGLTGKHLLHQADSVLERNDFTEADSLFTLAGQVFRNGGDKTGQIDALAGLVNVRYAMRRFQQTADMADSCLARMTDWGVHNLPLKGELFRLKGDASYFLRDNEASLKFRLKALSLLGSEKVSGSELIGITRDIGFLYMNQLNYIEAESFLMKALSLGKQFGDSLEMAKTLNDLGIVYYRSSQPVKSFLCYKEGLRFTNSSAAHASTRIRLAFGLGRHYREVLNLTEARHFISEAYDLLLASNPNDPVIFNISRDLAKILRDLGETDLAIRVLNYPLREKSENMSPHRHVAEADLYFDLGITYSHIRDYAKAEEHLLQAELKYDLGETSQFLDKASTYVSLGHLYFETGKKSKAENYLLRADKLFSENPLYPHVDYATLRRLQGELLFALGRPEEAIKVLDSAMASIHYLPWEPDPFDKLVHYEAISSILELKTGYLLRLYTHQSAHFENALETQFKAQLNFLDQLCRRSLDPGMRLQILGQQYGIFGEALQFATGQYNRLKDPSTFAWMVEIAEQGRDQILNSYLLRNAQQQGDWNSDSLLSRALQVQNALADLALEEYRENQASPSDKLEASGRKLRMEMEELNASFLENAGYLALEQQSLRKSLPNALRERFIDEGIAFLEYFVGTDETYAFLIMPQADSFFVLDYSDIVVAESIRTCMDELINPEKHASWEKTCTALLEFIEKPASILRSAGLSQLVIIPHGPLYSVPFEIFTLGDTDHSGADNVHSPVISYANSLQSLLYERQEIPGQKKLAAFFAPEYDEFNIQVEDTIGTDSYAWLVRSGKYALPGARREVEQIQAEFGGESFTGKMASEESFKKHAPQYQILHLSMHALLEEKMPHLSRLLFSSREGVAGQEDDQLFAAELSAMNLRAELAVLSACNTGAGAVVKGEGIQSISRSFQYAGVPAVVHSLWKVPDDATAQIMVNFYRNLLEGDDKARSLHRAKGQYLEDVADQRLKHPYYWAGFVLSGDFQPIDIQSHSTHLPKYLFGIIIALLAAGGLFTYNLIKRRSNREALIQGSESG